jgi:hypothetical protein
MGSDWLRNLTEGDPERRRKALEFQRTVDKLFSLGGGRGKDKDSPIRLADTFRRMAGFTESEIDDIDRLGQERREELEEMRRQAAPAPA